MFLSAHQEFLISLGRQLYHSLHLTVWTSISLSGMADATRSCFHCCLAL